MKKTKLISLFLITLVIAYFLGFKLKTNLLHAAYIFTITVNTNKQSYIPREIVNINGTVSFNDRPLGDSLIAVEIRDYLNNSIYRTLPTGDTVPADTTIRILEIIPCDTSGNPCTSFAINALGYFMVKIENTGAEIQAIITLNLFDKNMIPIGGYASQRSLGTGINTIGPTSIPIKNWAYIGLARIVANVYTNWPRFGGIPLCKEAINSVWITRTSVTTAPSPPTSPKDPLPTNGTFNTSFRLSPESYPSSYTVYVASGKYGYFGYSNITFQVTNVPTPPQASFTYIPSKAYVNATVTFDGSASSAEGYNDVIIRYEWDWGDGTQRDILAGTPEDPPPAIVTHKFTQVGDYYVTLNVTDTENLWCTTTKMVRINPPDPPQANFTWSPVPPVKNFPTTFNASISKPGFNGNESVPIISYYWDFGDNFNITTSNPIVQHTFTDNRTYTVTLIVTDRDGLQGLISYNVTVSSTLIGDINGDGVVDGLDLSIAARAFGSYPGHPKWDARADINGDNYIDGLDITIIARNYGKTAG